MGLVWIVVVGFVVGIIAKFLMPGKNEPRGFILTTILGIAGSFAASFLGQFFGFYAPGELSGFFGSIVGAIVLLWLWGKFVSKKEVA